MRRRRKSKNPAAVAGSAGTLTLREHNGTFYALKGARDEGAKAFLGHIYRGQLRVRADALPSALHTLRFRGFTVSVERAERKAA